MSDFATQYDLRQQFMDERDRYREALVDILEAAEHPKGLTVVRGIARDALDVGET